MIGDITNADKIYIVCGYTDMRKSIDGLCAIVLNEYHLNPKSRNLFLFCGKRCDRIKLLICEPDGFVLIYKRLSVEGRYQWPRNKGEARNLTWQEFDWLMSGLNIDQPKAIRAS
jgi:transposase